MSRLESFIRRMCAQRDILDDVVSRIGAVPGPVFEFGLGNGRTYDHLRQRFPDRRIVVFECIMAAHPLARPDPDDLMLGDIRDTAARFPDGCAALIHADIESGDAATDAALAGWLPALVARLLQPGGFGVSGCALADARLAPAPLPAGVEPGRYHVVRRAEAPLFPEGTAMGLGAARD